MDSTTGIVKARKKVIETPEVKFEPAKMKADGFDYTDDNVGYKASFALGAKTKNPFIADIHGIEILTDEIAEEGLLTRTFQTKLPVLYALQYSKDSCVRVFNRAPFKAAAQGVIDGSTIVAKPKKSDYNKREDDYTTQLALYLLYKHKQANRAFLDKLPQSLQDLQLKNTLNVITEQLKSIASLPSQQIGQGDVLTRARAVTGVCNEILGKSETLQYRQMVWEAQRSVVVTSKGKMNYALTRPSQKGFKSISKTDPSDRSILLLPEKEGRVRKKFLPAGKFHLLKHLKKAL